MLEKLNWFHLTGLITLVLSISKWVGLFLRKNHLLRCWGYLSLLKWIGSIDIISITKTAFKKIEVLICSMKFLSAGLLYISINLSYSLGWNTVAMSGLVSIMDIRTISTSLPACLESMAHC